MRAFFFSLCFFSFCFARAFVAFKGKWKEGTEWSARFKRNKEAREQNTNERDKRTKENERRAFHLPFHFNLVFCSLSFINNLMVWICPLCFLCVLCFKLKQAETNERVFNLNEQRTQREKAKHKTTLFSSIPLLFLFHFRSLHAYIHFVHFIVSERNEKKRRRNEWCVVLVSLLCSFHASVSFHSTTL